MPAQQSTMAAACLACAAAASTPQWGEFVAGCRGCCARAASRSPQFHEARKTGMQSRSYRALLDQFGLTHDEVKAAHAADACSTQGGAASCRAV